MIKGVGTDIVDIRRIEQLLTKYSEHFLKKVFTHSEIRYCRRMANPAMHLAGRWAVKEAFYKALPQAYQKHSSWKSIEVVTVEAGKPSICICSDTLKEFLEKDGIIKFHVSISHERSYCVAMVVLEEVLK